ncbi:MAG: Fe-S cluster assembly protein SufD [Verrucomicrobiota bacterium]
MTESVPILDGELPSEEPVPSSWWAERRKAAWEKFQDLPMPSAKDIDWRFASVRSLRLDAFQRFEATEDSISKVIDKSRLGIESAGQLVFANDKLQDFSSITSSFKEQGVIWTSLSEAVTEYGDLVEKYFMSQPIDLGSEKFASLHDAYCQAGSFLYVPKGVEVELPFLAFHWLSGENASVFPHTLIVAESMSKVTLVDFYQSLGDDPGLACSLSDLYVGEGAQVKYVANQNWSEKVQSFQINATECAKDSAARSLYINVGGKFSRIENQSRLMGSGARSEMLAVTASHDKQEFDQRTLQNHCAPHTWSDLLYKNALSNKSRCIFSGLIMVQEEAAHTDAYQTNRNLLLNPQAEADSMPGLEILNDDVKCSHGSTTGQVDEEELFYMLARGIDEKKAKELIVQGFLDEVTTRLELDQVEDWIRQTIAKKFVKTKAIEDVKEDLVSAKVSSAAEETVDLRKLQGLE